MAARLRRGGIFGGEYSLPSITLNNFENRWAFGEVMGKSQWYISTTAASEPVYYAPPCTQHLVCSLLVGNSKLSVRNKKTCKPFCRRNFVIVQLK